MAKKKVVYSADGEKVSLTDSRAAYIFDAADERLEKFVAALKEGRLNRPSSEGTVDLYEATGTPHPDGSVKARTARQEAEQDLRTMKVADLNAALESRGLETSGNRTEKEARLKEATDAESAVAVET